MTLENTIPRRSTCAMCNRVYAVHFWVPDEIWFEAIKQHYNNSRICLGCFINRADEVMLEWCKDIKLYPTSKAKHLRETRRIEINKAKEENQ